MKAVGFTQSLPITDPRSLRDLTLPRPTASGRDLLVRVHAVALNPVDVKVRVRAAPEPGPEKVLGFDAAGVVEAVGEGVSLFQPGDEVYYAGSIARQGSNAEYQLVDERIVAKRPRSLSWSAAAALPLTSITAWELLFERLAVPRGAGDGTLLVIGGAGGVGSLLIQLARKLTGLTVVATAARPESRGWCERMGAHHVVDHRQLVAELARVGTPQVAYVACLTATDQHFPAVCELVAPQGKIAVIDDPATLDIVPLKRKSVSVHWELMFTRALFETADMVEQHRLLTEVARLVDDGTLQSTHTETLGRIDAETLRKGHALIESGRSVGKLTLEGF